MAAGGHNDGAHGQGTYDPFLVPDDDFDDDILYLLDMNGGMDDPTLDINDDTVVDNSAPTHNALLADDPTTASGAQDVGGAGTSATAPRSQAPPSSAVHQNASLDCTGCQVLREVVHCNGRLTCYWHILTYAWTDADRSIKHLRKPWLRISRA